MRKFSPLLIAGLFAPLPLLGAVQGSLTPHPSPNGIQEACVALHPMPGGQYSSEDHQKEKAYCQIDFYDGSYGLCAKTFSTSPGTLLYDLTLGQYAGNYKGFEKAECYNGKRTKKGVKSDPVSYKMTMNAKGTSATFSTASLLYYHFSRYLDSRIHVPVSVWRSMDREEHLRRVSRAGLEQSSAKQNHAAWEVMVAAEKDPAAYPEARELFTEDHAQVYGILLHPNGSRYSAEFNGTRESGWGEGQSRDFQETAPFRALRSDKPLAEAIAHGIDQAWQKPALRKAMKSRPSSAQMHFWMQELTEIVILDYLFSQQDRIGNIDYLTYWYWPEHGMVLHRPAGKGAKVPADIAQHNPVLIKRTQLNDNDAGGHLQYSNFTKKTGMLEKVRHMNADTYRRLLRLDQDFTSQGKLYRYLRESFGLDAAQFEQIVNNAHEASAILQKRCSAGELRFDLNPEQYLLRGKFVEERIDCSRP